jgi:hypothetical protein
MWAFGAFLVFMAGCAVLAVIGHVLGAIFYVFEAYAHPFGGPYKAAKPEPKPMSKQDEEWLNWEMIDGRKQLINYPTCSEDC